MACISRQAEEGGAVLSNPTISVIIGTLDRLPLLNAAIESLLAQGVVGFEFEVIVVDNGPSAAIEEAIARFALAGHPIHYRIEQRKGVAHARNTGVRESRGRVIAFMDDDERAAPNWLQVLHRTFGQTPEIDFVGGRVRPVWTAGTQPDWLSAETRGAVSIIDWGDAPRPIDQAHWMCLPGGNMAVRRHVLDAVGGWGPYRRSQDRELTVRLLQAGYRGLYVPELVIDHYLDANKADRAHARRWHAVEGRMRAGYHFEELFDASGRIRHVPQGGRRLAGVSPSLYGRLLTKAGEWVGATARRRQADAFEHELKMRYFASYIWARLNSRRTPHL
jgi:glycosyltransferase involved in cell wall biosynthesis